MLDPGSGRGDEKIKREIALMAALAEVEKNKEFQKWETE